MIRYYGGVEGSGKSCMMTRDMILHHAAGGNLLTFPGYEIYGRNSNHIISRNIMPEQLLELVTGDREEIERIRQLKIAVGVDEVPNFFNHHTWYNKINDILTAILQQRRKLGIVFLMTGPVFFELPPDIRRMVHEVINCRDLHTINKSVPIGKICEYVKEDKRGLFCHPNFHWSYRKRFNMESWYRHFDTYAAISPLNQFVRVKFQSKELLYDSDGNPVESDMTKLESRHIDKLVMVSNKVAEWEQEGKELITPAELKQAIISLGLNFTNTTKSYFSARGLTFSPKLQGYVIMPI